MDNSDTNKNFEEKENPKCNIEQRFRDTDKKLDEMSARIIQTSSELKKNNLNISLQSHKLQLEDTRNQLEQLREQIIEMKKCFSYRVEVMKNEMTEIPSLKENKK